MQVRWEENRNAIDRGRAVIEAPRGTRYQIVIDGKRIVDIESKGRDVILL
ncbi:MAG: hypothetical protein VX252_09315 [Myxococcota bacterium]|nr:hypothetical protein [Myxococcota bacterium]